MFGWCGQIARINLTTGHIRIEKPPLERYQNFIGGRGLAGYYLRPFATLDWDHPDMPLLFFTGPLVNTPSPTSGRMTIMSRSPLTGTVGDTSVGGSLGRALKRAHLDGLIITGQSSRWCGIEINDEQIQINAAHQLEGMRVDAVAAHLKGRGANAIIGPAAENGVRFANIMVDQHFAAGRNGLGCVCAAKKLKYVTVKGTHKTAVHDPAGLKAARAKILRLVAASPALSGDFGIARFGTGALYDLIDARSMMPTDNFKNTRFPKASRLNAYAFQQAYHPRSHGCRGCHILCKKRTTKGTHLPEFETMSHFSALIGNSDLETVVQANRICNTLGMDTISAAVTLACYAEHSDRTLAPADIVTILQAIGEQTGIGVPLGQGAVRYARQNNCPEIAMAVKGQELPAYDPRGALGMALAYALSSRGACHLRAYPISHEILRKPVATDRFSFSGKARIIKIGEDLNAVVDSLTACKFIFFAATLEEYAQAYSAVTGIPATTQDLLTTGERIYYQERLINAANGFNRLDDDLPARFFEPPDNTDATPAIKPIDRQAFQNARADYYAVRGLDPNGRPREDMIRKLGLHSETVTGEAF
jgi:aldehyde:ferredoxin oxidoreductase